MSNHVGSSKANDTAAPRRKRGWAGSVITGLAVALAIGIGFAFGRFAGPEASETADGASTVAVADDGGGEWSCAMHPQIRQSEPGKCPICAMDLTRSSASAGSEPTGLRELTISREARALLDIRAAPVERKFVTAPIRMVGKVQADETRFAEITARFGGRLDRLYVDYTGVKVEKDDHLALIYSPEIYSAQAELIKARQALEQPRDNPALSQRADRLLRAVREKFRLWGATEDQIREIEQREKPSDHLTIYSPMAGLVHEKHALEGTYVDTGALIYTIVDLSEVWVMLDAYQSDLAWLRYGQEVTFTPKAYPGEEFTGRIVFIHHMLNSRTQTVKVRLNAANPGMKLKPGMFVHARVNVQVAGEGDVISPDLAGKWVCEMHPEVIRDEPGTCDVCQMPLVTAESLGHLPVGADGAPLEPPLVVPASAVLVTGKRAVVYVERADADKPTYEGREIVIGPRAGDYYLVRAGLRPGERVVTHGNFKIDSALQIDAKPSMMNPEGQGGGGGHDHGSMASAGDSEMDMGGMDHTSMNGGDGEGGMSVPPKAFDQLLAVWNAARKTAAAAQTGDREQIEIALNDVANALEAVEPERLDGHAAMVWKELHMRLTNGVVEGRWAVDDQERQNAVEHLMTDARRLQEQFGLPDADKPAALDVPETFQAELAPLWRGYLETQAALASDDLESSQAAARAFLDTLSSVSDSELGSEAREAWKSLRADFEAAGQAITEAPEIDAARSAFKDWSIALPVLLARFGLPDSTGTVYRLHCPMAFDNQGAVWFQADDTVRNPYFGAFMLQCADEVEPFIQPSNERGDERSREHDHAHSDEEVS